jgi:hypothetical protein
MKRDGSHTINSTRQTRIEVCGGIFLTYAKEVASTTADPGEAIGREDLLPAEFASTGTAG